MLPAYTHTVKRKASSTAKFYFFDIGVRNALIHLTSLPQHSDVFGQAFEHFIAMELRAYLSYQRIREPLTFWRSKHGDEVDFIIGHHLAIEVKSTDQVKDKHCKSLSRFAEEGLCKRYVIVSQDPTARKTQQIETLHWQDFLKQLWSGAMT
jgi:predicted AAA+ superfamily ATPase